MSKAILVIDIDDSYIPIKNESIIMKRGIITYRDLNNNPYSIEINNFCLKPMPERKEARKVKYVEDVVHIQTTYDYITNKINGQISYDIDRIFAEGYNACLDEIIGND